MFQGLPRDALIFFLLAAILFYIPNLIREHPSVAGSLLIATDKIEMEPFRESVILVIRHDRAGAFGLILNKPSKERDSIFLGGPVKKDKVHALYKVDTALDNAVKVGTLNLALGEEKGGQPQPLRIFAGYSGWGWGQLDREIRREDWLVVPAKDYGEEVFKIMPEKLWGELSKK